MIVGKRRKNTEQRGLPWFVIWFLCAETGAPAVESLRDKSVNGEKVTKVVSRKHACFPSKSKFIENKIGSAWGTPRFFFFFLSDRLTSEARACSPDVFHLSPFSFHFRYPEYTRLFFIIHLNTTQNQKHESVKTWPQEGAVPSWFFHWSLWRSVDGGAVGAQ